MKNIREALQEHYGAVDIELLFADGFDDAIVGVCAATNKVVYSYDAMAGVLMHRDNMTIEEALEYLDFNVVGAYVGENTPIYIHEIPSFIL